MVSKAHHPLVGSFITRLEERGQRITGSRSAVAWAVARQRGHFTVEQLCDELPKVGRATVYRNIKLLVDMGFVCRVLLEDGALHYQISHSGHHHHMICTECGVSQDLLGCDISGVLRETVAASAFAIEGHWLEVYGRCRNCAEAASKN